MEKMFDTKIFCAIIKVSGDENGDRSRTQKRGDKMGKQVAKSVVCLECGGPVVVDWKAIRCERCTAPVEQAPDELDIELAGLQQAIDGMQTQLNRRYEKPKPLGMMDVVRIIDATTLVVFFECGGVIWSMSYSDFVFMEESFSKHDLEATAHCQKMLESFAHRDQRPRADSDHFKALDVRARRIGNSETDYDLIRLLIGAQLVAGVRSFAKLTGRE